MSVATLCNAFRQPKNTNSMLDCAFGFWSWQKSHKIRETNRKYVRDKELLHYEHENVFDLWTPHAKLQTHTKYMYWKLKKQTWNIVIFWEGVYCLVFCLSLNKSTFISLCSLLSNIARNYRVFSCSLFLGGTQFHFLSQILAHIY